MRRPEQVDAETLEHVALGVSLVAGVILLARYAITGTVRTARVYEAVEGDGREPGLREWREEIRALLHQNADEHRVIGMRLDEVQAELAHNGGTSVKDAVHRTERKLDDHLAAADERQERLAVHVRRMIAGLEAQGIEIPPP